ncbi:uncharacterized protein [Rutidosis leptorrhynchoides]|uniref:uncharacterized protein n=1 Tax=Rutidosis leptorrhynchoides TaxID=125765 RepID=UPI003A996E2A
MSSHIWRILVHKQSLWVKWIHTYKLDGRSIWDVSNKVTDSFIWRIVLSIRPLVRSYFITKIGDGLTTNAWFDNWSCMGPLAALISRRDICRAGFSDRSLVADLVDHNTLGWPPDWLQKYPPLGDINCPVINDSHDSTVWKYNDSVFEFSVFHAWNALRPQAGVVNWCSIVWFLQSIPGHAFMLWLTIKKKLKTQDRLHEWEKQVGVQLICFFCKNCIESHDHLFFECSYTTAVWSRVSTRITFPLNTTQYLNIIDLLIPVAGRGRVDVIVAKLVLAATIYFAWQERNYRCFKGKVRSDSCLADQIMSTVRLKLLSLRFKESPRVTEMRGIWVQVFGSNKVNEFYFSMCLESLIYIAQLFANIIDVWSSILNEEDKTFDLSKPQRFYMTQKEMPEGPSEENQAKFNTTVDVEELIMEQPTIIIYETVDNKDNLLFRINPLLRFAGLCFCEVIVYSRSCKTAS